MKKNISYLLLGVCLVLMLGANPHATKQLQTIHSPYILLRDAANEDTSLVTLATAGDFANKPSGAMQLDADANGVAIIICGGAAADKTLAWKAYGWRRNNGPAEMIAYGTATLGTQQVVKYPDTGTAPAATKFWADTIAITEQAWLATVWTADAEGNNRVGKLCFDYCGYEWLYVEITSADGATGTEAGLVSVYFAYY